MEFGYFLDLIFLLVVNICFLLSGICLNSLVIISFWRSAQLRKKLCYFMIMVLSCCDLFAILTSYSYMAYSVITWFSGNGNSIVDSSWVHISEVLSNVSLGLSLLALLVMNFDRYLATYYPIFHRTSVTKGKLLTLLATLFFFKLVEELMWLNSLISCEVFYIIFFTLTAPPMLFMSYKLFIIARKSRGNRDDMRKTFSLKNISSCLLAVACFMAFLIPTFVYVGLSPNAKKKKMI